LIVLKESAAVYEANKLVICKKCRKGKLGSIPERSKAAVAKRGKPPPDGLDDFLQVKYTVCGTHWDFTIEYENRVLR
jgi:hypothetical protein